MSRLFYRVSSLSLFCYFIFFVRPFSAAACVGIVIPTQVEELTCDAGVLEHQDGLALIMEQVADDEMADEVARVKDKERRRTASAAAAKEQFKAAAAGTAHNPILPQAKPPVAWTPGRGLTQVEAKHYLPADFYITKDTWRHFRWQARTKDRSFTTSLAFGRNASSDVENRVVLNVLRACWQEHIRRTDESECPWDLDGDLF